MHQEDIKGSPGLPDQAVPLDEHDHFAVLCDNFEGIEPAHLYGFIEGPKELHDLRMTSAGFAPLTGKTALPIRIDPGGILVDLGENRWNVGAPKRFVDLLNDLHVRLDC